MYIESTKKRYYSPNSVRFNVCVLFFGIGEISEWHFFEWWYRRKEALNSTKVLFFCVCVSLLEKNIVSERESFVKRLWIFTVSNFHNRLHSITLHSHSRAAGCWLYLIPQLARCCRAYILLLLVARRVYSAFCDVRNWPPRFLVCLVIQ